MARLASYFLYHSLGVFMITLHTNFGDICLELNPEKAPKTCANFTQYVEDGFYDGTIFHRVINNFMVHDRRHEAKNHPRHHRQRSR
jgi:cyclophilin family peptidyl-prolyl cis-trans isomerase